MNTKTTMVRTYRISHVWSVVNDTPHPSPYADVGFWHEEREYRGVVGILERYYNDLYKHLLARLAHFDATALTTPADAADLSSVLAELVKVKTLLEQQS